MARSLRAHAADGEATAPDLIASIRGRARPLRTPHDLDPLIERIGPARFVLLGEASHGTADYYDWRAEISRRLIVEQGFQFIAVEGDWPACDALDRWVRGRDDGRDVYDVLQAFDRWPTWMWANEEVTELARWLRDHNAKLPPERQVGFHGLDMYSLWESLYAVLGYLRRVDSSALDAARKAFRCFEPYGEDAQEYGWSASRLLPSSCEDEAIELLLQMQKEALAKGGGREARDEAFRAEQNALVVRDAEAYYRTMIGGGPESWNIRDRHMMDTLERLARHYGPGSKAIVWEHNTHIGDARFTDMADEGMFNVGQLARERLGREGVVLVGFGSHRGRVIAGRSWEATMEEMPVPEARPGSWEDLLHRAGAEDKLLLLGGANDPPAWQEPRGHRAIGVVYRPQHEHLGNYVPTVLPRRYDAFLYVDQTRALRPVRVRVELEKTPETFPSGR